MSKLKKKGQWKLVYERGDGIVEITLRDHRGAKIDTFKANQMDKKAHGKIANILKDKYGISFVPTINKEEIKIEKEGFFDY